MHIYCKSPSKLQAWVLLVSRIFQVEIRRFTVRPCYCVWKTYKHVLIGIDGHVCCATANVDYHLSFADQGKQTIRFPYTVYIYIHILKRQHIYSIDINIHVCVCVYVCIHIYIYNIYAAISTGKRKPRRFSLILLFFAHYANGSLPFVCLFTEKQTD